MTQEEEEAAHNSHQKVDQAFDKIYDKYLKIDDEKVNQVELEELFQEADIISVHIPFTVENQTAIIYAGSKNLLRNVPVNQVKAFERAYLDELNAKHRPVLDSIKAGKLTDEVLDTLNAVAKSTSAQFE